LQTLGMFYAGDAIRARTRQGERITDASFLVLFHGGDQEAEFVLPAAPWATAYQRLFDTADERPRPAAWTDAPGDVVVLAARSLVLLEVQPDSRPAS
jgi:glycogen operon protein